MSLDYILDLLKKEEYERLIEELNLALEEDSTNPMYFYYRFLAYNKDYNHIDYKNLVDEKDLNNAIALERDYSYNVEFQLFKELNKDLRNLFLLANRMESYKLKDALKKKLDYDGLSINVIHHIGAYIFSLNDLVQLELIRDIIETIIDDKEFPLYNELDRIIPLSDYLNKRIELKGNEFGLSFKIQDGVLLDVTPKNVYTICIPDGVVKISDNVFKGFSNLKIVKIPDSVESIGKNAFSGCESLIQVKLPFGLKEIGIDAFRDCKSLTEIKIPNSIERVDMPILAGAKVLESIEMPVFLLKDNTIASLFDDIEFEGSIKVKKETTNGNVETYFLPSKLHEVILTKNSNPFDIIPSHAFENILHLNHVEIPEGIKDIYPCAFKGLSRLTYIALPSSLTKIQYSAFQNTGLESLDIPENVREIGAWAFFSCDELNKVYFPNGVLINVGYHAFSPETAIYNKVTNKPLTFQ